MHSTILPLSALLSLLGTLQGIVALPTLQHTSKIITRTAPKSTTVLGAPLAFTRDAHGSPVAIVPINRRTPETTPPPVPQSKTVLAPPLGFSRDAHGSPVALTRTSTAPKQTTVPGEPLQFTRTLAGTASSFLPSPTSTGYNASSPSQNSPSPSNHSVPNTNLAFGSHYGWVGFFTDPTCDAADGPIGDRPKMSDQACHKVNPTNETGYVKISWGTWPLGFGALDVFEDADCKVKVDSFSAGEGDCVEMGKVWGSVQSRG